MKWSWEIWRARRVRRRCLLNCEIIKLRPSQWDGRKICKISMKLSLKIWLKMQKVISKLDHLNNLGHCILSWPPNPPLPPIRNLAVDICVENQILNLLIIVQCPRIVLDHKDMSIEMIEFMIYCTLPIATLL